MKRVVSHLALWLLYASLEVLANLPHYSDVRELVVQTLFFLPVIAMPFYFVAYVLVPKLLWSGQKWRFWCSCVVVLLLVLFIRLYWTNWYWTLQEGRSFHLPFSKTSKNLIRDYALIGFAVALKIIRDWDEKDRQNQQLRQGKRDAELQLLQAQIHPHFLFNTLNNLYGLALQQSPHTPSSILRLSGLLDCILYECNADQIPLKKEIQLIEDYIELERLRFGERLQLTFLHDPVPGTIDIAPLLLLPFVENAFKHGASKTNLPVEIKIHLRLAGQSLYFEVFNSNPKNDTGEPRGSKGIGLKNVEKRLQWLYPGRHSLEKTAAGGVFLILLKIDL